MLVVSCRLLASALHTDCVSSRSLSPIPMGKMDFSKPEEIKNLCTRNAIACLLHCCFCMFKNSNFYLIQGDLLKWTKKLNKNMHTCSKMGRQCTAEPQHRFGCAHWKIDVWDRLSMQMVQPDQAAHWSSVGKAHKPNCHPHCSYLVKHALAISKKRGFLNERVIIQNASRAGAFYVWVMYSQWRWRWLWL